MQDCGKRGEVSELDEFFHLHVILLCLACLGAMECIPLRMLSVLFRIASHWMERDHLLGSL